MYGYETHKGIKIRRSNKLSAVMSQYYYYNCSGVLRVFYFDSDYDFKLFKETIQQIDDDNKCGTYTPSTLHKLIQSWSVPSGILSSIAVIYYNGTNDCLEWLNAPKSEGI